MNTQQPDPRDTRNLIIAMGLVMTILIGWGYFKPEQAPDQADLPSQTSSNTKQDQGITTPQVAGKTATAQLALEDSSAKQVDSNRIQVTSENLLGSIRQVGARLDDLKLKNYTVAIDSSEPVELLKPESSKNAYFVDTGWVKGSTSALTLPTASSAWSVTSGETLTPQSPVTLSWVSPEGITFERTFTIDENFLITVTDRVINGSENAVELAHYGQISRENPPAGAGFAILHEGPIGRFEKTNELKYEDLEKPQTFSATGGWAGYSDKYWLTSLIPDQQTNTTFTYRSILKEGVRRYFVESVSGLNRLAPGDSLTKTINVYAGAKVLNLLDAYEKVTGAKDLDRAVDFGMFYFLTKPLFKALNFLKNFLGNFGIAILVLTVVIKLILFPVANKSFRSMARMKALKPKLDRLKEQCGDDKMKFAQAQMELFKKEKVNPMAGCLPMLAQIPIFFALYKVLFISIEMRHAPFFGWIQDLSAPDPTSLFNLFGLLPFDPPGFLQIGLWPIIMGVSMFLQQKMNPAPQDPVQEKMFMFLPIIFTFMLANFPAGLVIYWTWNNLLSMAQQATIMKLENKSKA